ncbi:MAG: hypothetical protein J6W84_06210 [Bacteroidales bacterium]|nr:hypothetical protein [Bacteroidales bacterium]
MYLTFEEYATWGGQLDAPNFPLAELEARLLLDRYTFGRLKNEAEEDIPEAVKFCMFKLIEYAREQQELFASPTMSDNESSLTTGISSQSNDGVSISYNVMSASEIYAAKKAESQDILGRYLQGVTNSAGQELLFRGMYLDE